MSGVTLQGAGQGLEQVCWLAPVPMRDFFSPAAHSMGVWGGRGAGNGRVPCTATRLPYKPV